MRTHRWLGLLTLLSAAPWTGLAQENLAPAQSERPEPPPFLGEKLRYAMAILGVAGGELTLSAQRTDLEGRPVYKLEMSAVSNDVVSRLFLVRDYLASWVDPRSWRSLRFEKHTVEGSRVRDEAIEFDYEKGVAKKDDGSTVLLEEATLDSLSSVYFLRTLPLDVGKPIELRVFSRKAHTLRVEVQARERVTTPAGTFDTIRIEPKSTEGGLIGKGKTLVLWLTNDARRIPVQIQSRLKVGKLVGRLRAIEKN